jgi:methionyl-tRNA formyltransferase
VKGDPPDAVLFGNEVNCVPDLRFAFLVLQEHPYGREMLRILLALGFCPRLVVEEVSAVAEEEREKFLIRIAGQPVPPTMASLVAGREIPHYEVGNHNSARCRELLDAFAPELVVLGGTRILRPPILAIPPRGTVNAHPGLLPRLRGSSSVGWALYKDLPVGATVHFVEEGIDTGPIIVQRALDVRRGDSYESLVRRVLMLAGELMAETLDLLRAGEVKEMPQDPTAGETLRVIPPDLLAEGKARLAEGRYSHLMD